MMPNLSRSDRPSAGPATVRYLSAVAKPSLLDGQPVADSEALAWAAGFFDGEGHAGTVIPRGHAFPRFQLVVTQYECTTLERFQSAVGLGRIYTANKPAPSGRKHSC